MSIKKLKSTHAAKAIRDVLKEELLKWGLLEQSVHDESYSEGPKAGCSNSSDDLPKTISQRKFVWTTDGGTNIKKAITLEHEWERIYCVGHLLALAVEDSVASAIPQVGDLIAKSSGIVGHFAHSTTDRQILFQKQELLNPEHQPLAPLGRCKTRWNSTLDMLSRLLILKEALLCTWADENFNGNKPLLTDKAWDLARMYVNVFSIAQDATVLLSGEKYATISMYLPTYFALIEALKKKLTGGTASAENNLAKTFMSKLQVNTFIFDLNCSTLIAFIVLGTICRMVGQSYPKYFNDP